MMNLNNGLADSQAAQNFGFAQNPGHMKQSNSVG